MFAAATAAAAATTTIAQRIFSSLSDYSRQLGCHIGPLERLLLGETCNSTTTMVRSSSLHSLGAALLCGATTAACTGSLNITWTQTNTTLAPSPLPLPGASSQGEEIVRQFRTTGRSTKWKLVQKTAFEGNTFEPEGFVRIGDDRFFVSAGEYTQATVTYPNSTIINGTDRSPGAGFGHLIVFDAQGHRIADASLSQAGSVEYHPGGIDYDGTSIWVPLAQYRPNSTATILRVDPATLEPEPVFHVADHQGGVVHDLSLNTLVTLNWGSRNASLWNLNYPFAPVPQDTAPRATVANPGFYIDYQDCKYLGHSQTYGWKPVMMCSGITTLYNSTLGNVGGSGVNIGGVAILDMETMTPLWEVPLTMVTDAGNLVTKNPFDVAIVDGKMRLYFLPDDFNSTLYVYEAA